MVDFIGTFHRYCVLGHSANAEDTILAGRSAASPKAPPLRFFVESIATDHQEVSSFFSEKKTVLLRFRTRDLEPRVVSPDQPATVTYLFY